MSITKKVIFIAKQGNEEQLKDLLKDMVAPSKQEVGVLAYDIYQVKSDLAKFVVIESWESEEALEGHRHTNHYKHYKANFELFCKEKYAEDLSPL